MKGIKNDENNDKSALHSGLYNISGENVWSYVKLVKTITVVKI